jgi:hypothetical protein
MKIKWQRRKGEGFILNNFAQSTFSGTVFENSGPNQKLTEARKKNVMVWPVLDLFRLAFVAQSGGDP